MTYRVAISIKARISLQEAARWYRARSGSEAVAAKWLDRFLAKLATLSECPERCSLARESDLFSEEVREIHFGAGRRPSHRALFQIHGNTVEIVAIRHIAQDDVTPESL